MWDLHHVWCTAGERRWHVTIPLAISSLALASMSHTMAHSPFLAFISLLAATLAWAPNGIMYSYPATFLQGAAAATGVALINSIANIGGMIGPYLIGGRATLSALLFWCLCGQTMAVQVAWQWARYGVAEPVGLCLPEIVCQIIPELHCRRVATAACLLPWLACSRWCHLHVTYWLSLLRQFANTMSPAGNITCCSSVHL